MKTNTTTTTNGRMTHEVSVEIDYTARRTLRARTFRYTFKAKSLAETLDRVGRLAWELNDYGHSVSGVRVHGMHNFGF